MTIRRGRVFAGLVLLWLVLAWDAGAATLALREAHATITVNGVTTQAAVTLPYNWDRLHRGQPGTATFDVAFALAEHPSEPYEVYFVRLGNAYEVWLNGTMLERNGDLQAFNSDDYGQVPRAMALPPQLLKKTTCCTSASGPTADAAAASPSWWWGPTTRLMRCTTPSTAGA